MQACQSSGRFSLGVLLSLGNLAITSCAYPFNVQHSANPICWVSSVCIPYRSKDYKILQRSFFYPRQAVPQTLWEDYCEEYQYISARRAKVRLGKQAGAAMPKAQEGQVAEKQPSSKPEGGQSECRQMESGTHPPEELSGIAFSGGGIRSATFHLGVLQALRQIPMKPAGSDEELTLLEHLDYISTVSGGSYISGWMLSHLSTHRSTDPTQQWVDPYGFAVQTDDPDGLLDPSRNLMLHLRDRAGFVKEGGFCEICKLLWAYAWRLPFYLVWDLGLHAKTFPTPEIGNGVHLFNPTRDRIQGTYFRARGDTALADVNGDALAPYLIVNANLVNKGRLLGTGGRYVGERDNYSFEFTRDFSGTDALGYVETPGFGRPVLDVTWSRKGGSAEPIPVSVLVAEPDEEKARKADAFLLAEAVTTSGAAFDLESTLASLTRDATSQTVLRYALSPLNLNFEFQTWNFARPYNGLWSVWDYIRMVTYQRLFWPHTDARWIEVTDGAFYDNLGVMTLLRRGVSHIFVGDATLDSQWQYHYLEKLRTEAIYYGLDWCTSLPDHGKPGSAYKKFWVRRPDRTFAVIHYLKPYADNEDLPKPTQPQLHLQIERIPILAARAILGRDLKPGEWSRLVEAAGRDSAPEKKRREILKLMEQLLEKDLTPEQRRHAYRIEGEYFSNHISLERVTMFAKSAMRNGFPHTSTFLQWYEPEEFEAYRALGYLMAKVYLSALTFDEAARTPSSADDIGGCR